MKLFIIAALLFVCVVGVLSTSPMNCAGCDPQYCTRQACPCGSYKDECDCCDRCFICPGDECNYFAGDRCMLDRPCTPPDGLTVMESMVAGKNGICVVPEEADNDLVELNDDDIDGKNDDIDEKIDDVIDVDKDDDDDDDDDDDEKK